MGTWPILIQVMKTFFHDSCWFETWLVTSKKTLNVSSPNLLVYVCEHMLAFFSFLPLLHHAEDLVGDLESGLQIDSSSRCGWKRVGWRWELGVEGRFNLVVKGCGRVQKAGAARTQGRGLLAIKEQTIGQMAYIFFSGWREKELLKGYGEGFLAIGTNGWRVFFSIKARKRKKAARKTRGMHFPMIQDKFFQTAPPPTPAATSLFSVNMRYWLMSQLISWNEL